MSKEKRPLVLQLGIPFNNLFTTSIFRWEYHIQKIAVRFFLELQSLDRRSPSCVINVSSDVAYVYLTKNTTGKIMA